jgi:ribosomal protein S18 acetylase RimI-like enzyme
MVAVIDGSKYEDKIERADSEEDIAHNYRHLVNCDPYQDMLFSELNGVVIGYSRVTWKEELDGKRLYVHFGFLMPEFRGRGIGRAMLRYNQLRLHEITAEHPNHHPRFFESYAVESEISATALLLSEGYAAIRHNFEMVRPDLENISEAPMPPGLEVRPVQMNQLQAIRDASVEAFRDHWGFSQEEEPSVEQIVGDRNFDPSLWRVAWDGDQVAGMVLSFIDHSQNAEYNRLRGWTENICVRRPWRKRGLARSLIVQSLWAVKERGMTEAALGVDTENLTGALRLYEGVGFRPVKRWSIYRLKFN